MSPHPKDRRSPEQIARSMEIVKKRKQQQQKEETLSKINRGRLTLIVVGVLFGLSGLIEYMSSEVIEVFYFIAPVVVFYIVLAIFYSRNPIVVAFIGLSFYVLVLILDAFFDPSTLYKGIIVKGIIIYSFYIAIKTAKEHKELLISHKKENNDDILDSELI